MNPSPQPSPRRRAARGLLLMLVLACSQQSSAPPPASETVTPAPVAGSPRVVFPNGFAVAVEIAATPELRAQGLMFRDHLNPASGMLFFFPENGVYDFWMKNTLIPLDMIWIDEGRKIVHIKSDVPPCRADPCPSYDPAVEARYVLEVAAGEAGKRGFRVGDVVRFEGMENVIVR
jgi:uncharacterized membrane protein (UPF0127 family)